jgi:hypothetical protein
MILAGIIASRGTEEVGGITPPSFIQSVQTVFNTTTDDKVTSSFSVQTGDILIAIGMAEDHGSELTVSGGSLTWNLVQDVLVSDYSRLTMWSAVASSSTSMTVTFSRGTVRNFGGAVLVFRGSSGIGASSKTNSTGAPSLGITTTADNSVIVCATDDWNAINGSSRTWRTVNSITPASGSGETTYVFNSGLFTNYVAYYSNSGTAGSKTVGLSAPTGQKYSIAAVEIKGT